jgi:carbon starvation protein
MSSDPTLGFLAHARRFGAGLEEGRVIAPAKSLVEMQKIILNDRTDAALCIFFILVTVVMTTYGVRACVLAVRSKTWSARETSEPAPVIG